MSAGMELHVALSMRLDATEAYRLANNYRAEVLREGAALLEDKACDADWDKSPDYCAGLRAGAELLLAAGEEATGEAATATPDFFVAGRTYTRDHGVGRVCRFLCEHLTTDPQTGEREAWGWLIRSDGSRRMQRMQDDDYAKWTAS